MSLAAPRHAEDIEEAKKLQAESRRRHTHGAVWPDGRVTEHHCPPPEKGVVGLQRGDVPLLWINGEVQVVARWAKRGVRLLSDVCKQDGVPERYLLWRDAITHRGKVAIRNYEALYPPTVHKLRRESAAGVSEDMVFDGVLGLVPATPENMASRVADLAESAGVGRPIRQAK